MTLRLRLGHLAFQSCDFEHTWWMLSETCVFAHYIMTFVTATNVKLVGGKYANEGRIEIKHNGTWGSVCGTDFDATDARVVCSMLGYNNP